MLNTFIAREVRTIYLPRSAARAHDLPMGNPFGGVAYGKREDPITAAFAAIGTSAFGVAELAIVAGTIGAGATVIGAITGSKALMNIGKVFGLVGAVAGVANITTGLFSEAATGAVGTIGDMAGEMGAMESATAFGGEAAIGSTAGGVEGLIAPSGIEGSAIQGGGVTGLADSGSLSSQGLIASNTPGSALSQMQNSAVSPSLGSPLQQADMTGGAITQAGQAATTAAPTAQTVTAPGSTGPTQMEQSMINGGKGINLNNAKVGWLDKMMNSPYAPIAAMQGVGSGIQAVGGYLTNQEQIAYNEQLRKERQNNISAAARLYS